MKIDVVLGLQYGDEGKGKICHSLLTKNKYTHVLRFNGGGNAGHTIYHNGKKMVTHLIPSGVFYGIKSIIGPGCVVNVQKFFEELIYLKDNGIDICNNVFIAKNAHIVTQDNVDNDKKDTQIGTTKSGNGPAYSEKYNRTGVRAESIPALKPYLIDMYEEFYLKDNKDITILAEGAQALGLDIDWGDYPFVTSSHCGVGSVLLNGFNTSHIRDVFGIIKGYDTYVGAKNFQGDDPNLEKIQIEGQEFGATTGRKRQCNWLDWDLVEKSVNMNGVNRLVVNKIDILEKVNVWKVKYKNQILDLNDKQSFESWIKKMSSSKNVYFSYDPYDFDMKVLKKEKDSKHKTQSN
jgi:adenylosuccinate synthase